MGIDVLGNDLGPGLQLSVNHCGDRCLLPRLQAGDDLLFLLNPPVQLINLVIGDELSERLLSAFILRLGAGYLLFNSVLGSRHITTVYLVDILLIGLRPRIGNQRCLLRVVSPNGDPNQVPLHPGCTCGPSLDHVEEDSRVLLLRR